MSGLRIMVAGSFTASHVCVDGFPHKHTWHVTAYFNAAPRADARLFREALDQMLARWSGKSLPEGADWNEDIALTIASLVNCVEVVVWREADRIGARWPA